MRKPDRIDGMPDHFNHLARELRRIGFRTRLQWYRDTGETVHIGMLKRGDWNIHVVIPSLGAFGKGLCALYQRHGARSVTVVDHIQTVHVNELTAHINGALYQLEQLAA